MTFDSYIFAQWRLILQGINSVISNNLSLKVYTIKLQRYRDKKNWVCGKGAIFLLSSYLCVESRLDKLRCHKVVPVMLHNLTFSCWRIRNVTILSKLGKKIFWKGPSNYPWNIVYLYFPYFREYSLHLPWFVVWHS